MKLPWFHLMPYTELPDDFRDKHPSVWVDIDSSLFDPERYVIVGAPEEVTEQLREVAHTLNVGHLMLLLQFGNMGKELAKYNTGLFAEKVMPALRDIFAGWEDRWWPQPMRRDARVMLPAFQPDAVAAE